MSDTVEIWVRKGVLESLLVSVGSVGAGVGLEAATASDDNDGTR